MSLPMVLRPEAELDLTEARSWYEGRQVGLGDDFIDKAYAAFDVIIATPFLFGTVWKNVRAFRLQKFPYLVYYRVLIDRIEVLAVMHGSRDPARWKARVRS